MNAIYRGKLYQLADNLNVVELIDPDTGIHKNVLWNEGDLIIDPTDDEINNILPDWSGSPDPADPDNFWIDDETGERVNASTGERTKQ